jgi:hypothetical protein
MRRSCLPHKQALSRILARGRSRLAHLKRSMRKRKASRRGVEETLQVRRSQKVVKAAVIATSLIKSMI